MDRCSALRLNSANLAPYDSYDVTGPSIKGQRRATANGVEHDGPVANVLKQRANAVTKPLNYRKRSFPSRSGSSEADDGIPITPDPLELMQDPRIRSQLQQTTQQAAGQLSALVDGLQRAEQELGLNQ